MRRSAILASYAFLALLLVAAAAGPALARYRLVQGPTADDPLQAYIYCLENGLTVFLTVNDQEPRFHAEIAVRAGSKNDPDELTGMAHYMEHMLFKGTSRLGTLDYAAEKVHLDRIQALYEERFACRDSLRRAELYAAINEEAQRAAEYAVPSELDRLYTAMGERNLNAGTSYEFIAYSVDLPRNHLQQWARIEAERFAEPVFRLFQTELETVYEEMNMRVIDNRDALLRNAVNALLYRSHPYGRPIIGTVADLQNPSIRRMYDFYAAYYVPANMAVIVSGDLDPQAAIETIDAEFSRWPAAPPPPPRRWPEPKIASVRRDTVYYPGEESVLLAFRTQPSTHPDGAALRLADMVLDNAVAGLINLNLNQPQRVRKAGSYSTAHGVSNDYGAQYLFGVPKEGQSLAEVEGLLLEQIERLRAGDFPDWLVPAIVTDFRKTRAQQLENNGDRVEMLRDAFVAGQSWAAARAQFARLERLRKRDVVRVARKYFDRPYVVGYRLDGPPAVPPVTKPQLDPIAIDVTRQSALAREILAMEVPPIEPEFVQPGRDFEVVPVRDGVRLYHAHNPLNELFAFTFAVDLGTWSERRLAVARELLDKCGTPRFTPVQLKQEWYRLGTDVTVAVNDHEFAITLAGLDDRFADSVALLAELLAAPTADEATLAELKRIVRKNREDATKDPRTIHQALAMLNRHGDRSYYRRVLSNAELDALTLAELQDLIRSLPTYAQRWAYAGPRSAAEAAAAVAHAWPLPAELREPPPFEPLWVRDPGRNEIYLFDQEMAQALIRLDFGGVPYDRRLATAIQLFNEYFYGGMSGIVFQELREARALAYSTWAYFFEAARTEDRNMASGYISTQADKTGEAVAAFVGLFDQMPVTPARFASAREALLGRWRSERLGFRRVLEAVRSWELQGLAADPRAETYRQLQEASIADLLAFYRDHVQGKAKLISIVGDRRRLDLDALRQHGEVIEVRLEDIFAF